MPIAKTYKRYAPLSSFGVIGSTRSNILLNDSLCNHQNSSAGYAVTAAVENVIIWDIKKGEKVMLLKGEKQEVTALAKTADLSSLAVGYSDGMIRLWNLKNNSSEITLSGH